MRILTAPHIWIALLAWGAFVPIAWLLPSSWLFDVVNALSIAVGCGVAATYMPGLLDGLRQRTMSGAHYLVSGIVITWVTTGLRNGWNWAWRWLGEPQWMINSAFVAFLVWVLISAGVLHMLAQDAIDGNIPRENWVRLGKWVFMGVAMAGGVILWFEPSPYRQ